MKEQLKRLVQEAAAASLAFLLVGGHAVILYAVPRFTRDIDILVPDAHYREWRALLERMGYRFFHGTAAFAQFDPPETEMAGVDLMIVDDGTWGKLEREAVVKELEEGTEVRVPDVLHLIAMKLKASSAAHRRADATDFSDVIRLMRVQRIDLESEQTSEIVLKYGGDEALEALREALSRE